MLTFSTSEAAVSQSSDVAYSLGLVGLSCFLTSGCTCSSIGFWELGVFVVRLCRSEQRERQIRCEGGPSPPFDIADLRTFSLKVRIVLALGHSNVPRRGNLFHFDYLRPVECGK
jgi:hypothetical protein